MIFIKGPLFSIWQRQRIAVSCLRSRSVALAIVLSLLILPKFEIPFERWFQNIFSMESQWVIKSWKLLSIYFVLKQLQIVYEISHEKKGNILQENVIWCNRYNEVLVVVSEVDNKVFRKSSRLYRQKFWWRFLKPPPYWHNYWQRLCQTPTIKNLITFLCA